MPNRPNGYETRMGHLLDGILRLPPAIALALVFLLPALEASAFVGVVLPGEIGVILGGVLANQGKLPLAAVLVAGIAGAVIGDSVGYWVGGRFGERILGRIPDRLLDQDKLDRAEASIRRLGGKSVFVGRFTAALRALVPSLAGMSRLPYRRFLAWNMAGGAIWAAGFVVIGYLAGSQYQRIEHYANYIGIALLVLIAAVFLVRRRRRKAHSGDAPARPDDEDTKRRERTR